MVPEDTSLGHLEIFEVYEYLDGPRLFATRNNIGTMFLVYWFDEAEDATGWLYLPISETRLSRLRRKEISLHEAFREPETEYYVVYTAVPPRKDSADLVKAEEIDADYLPPDGYFIEYADVLDDETDGWSFETIIGGKKPSAEGLSQFIGRFRELIEDMMRNRGGRTLRLYGALPGSIRLKFGADDDADVMESLKIVERVLNSASPGMFREQLIEHRINPSQLQDFLSAILRNRLDVEIAPKLGSDGAAFKLPTDRIQRCMTYLEEVNYLAVDSIKIPQADDIDKVLEVLEMMRDGTPLIHENIEGLNTERQVRYYTDAAYAYGLATKDRQLTTAGQLVVSHSDRENQYQILADRFETTDFGWAWMKWAQVRYMTDLDPETAVDFILASVPELSEVTARRRASTLRTWLTKLKPYHRKHVAS